MDSINDIQNEILDEFSSFDDWMQRYEYMIELGKSLPLINPEFKTDDNIIKGVKARYGFMLILLIINWYLPQIVMQSSRRE